MKRSSPLELALATWLVVALLAAAPRVSAQVVTRVVAPPGARGISAADFVARVLSESPDLAEASALAARADAAVDEARALPSPHLRGGVGAVDVSGARAPTETFVALAVPVDYAGRTARRTEAARAEHEVTRADVHAVAREVRGEALARFVAALAAAARAQTMARSVLLADEVARAAEARVAVGEASEIEASLARLASATAHAELAAAEGAARTARLAMAALLRDADGALAPEGELAVAPRHPEAASVVALATATRPDLLAARLAIAARERSRETAHADRWPALAVEVGWLHSFQSLDSLFNQPEYDALTLALDVELPLRLAWDGDLRGADAAVEAAEANALATELRLTLEVRSALAEYEAARDALAAIASGPVPEAARLEALVSSAFEHGEQSLLVLLSAREHVRAVERTTLDALAQHALRLAVLLVASGDEDVPF